MPAKPLLAAWWYDLTIPSLGRYFGASTAYFGNRRPISWESGENHMVLWGGWDYWAMGGYYTFFGIDTDLELRHFSGADVKRVLKVNIPMEQYLGLKDPYTYEVEFNDEMYCRLPF